MWFKRLPLFTLCLGLIYCSVFFGLQNQDSVEQERLEKFYASSPLPALEWPRYAKWLGTQQRLTDLDRFDHLVRDKDHAAILETIQHDQAFIEALLDQKIIRAEDSNFAIWQTARHTLGQYHQLIFRDNYALHTHSPAGPERLAQLISHSFLHPNLLTLGASLVILLLCAWPLEQAIGTLRSACLYLLSSLITGALFWYLPGNTHEWLSGHAALASLVGGTVYVYALRRVASARKRALLRPLCGLLVLGGQLALLPAWYIGLPIGLMLGIVLCAYWRRPAKTRSQRDPLAQRVTQARQLSQTTATEAAQQAWLAAITYAPTDLALLQEAFYHAHRSPRGDCYHAIVTHILRLPEPTQNPEAVHHFVLSTFHTYLHHAQPRPHWRVSTLLGLLQRFMAHNNPAEVQRCAQLLELIAPGDPRTPKALVAAQAMLTAHRHREPAT